MACTCLPRSPDPLCSTHGYDTWRAEEPDDTAPMQAMPQGDGTQEGEGEVPMQEVREAQEQSLEEEWLSECCGAPPHGLTPLDTSVKSCEKCNGTGARHVAGEPVWQEPCGECSGEGTVCTSVGDNPAGICGQCKEHCGFERSLK